jgi:hypothetical protein
MADPTIDEQIELQSAESEGIMGEMKTDKGRFVFGVRSFVLAAILVVAYSLMAAWGFTHAVDPAAQAGYFGSMEKVVLIVIVWFAISKTKANGGT